MGRYDRLLRRTTAQVGPGSKVGEALEDLFPVLEVENAPAELLRASGWKLGMGRAAVTSAVGTTPAVQLFNPANSGMLIVLTDLWLSTLATIQLQFGPVFVALATTSVAGAERDTRAGAIAPTVGRIQTEDDGTASAFGIMRMLANTPQHLYDQNGLAVLAPGTGFIVTSGSTAVSLEAGFMWRERSAEPEELDF